MPLFRTRVVRPTDEPGDRRRLATRRPRATGWVCVPLLLCGSCFNPNDGDLDSATEGTGSTSVTTGTSAPTTSTTASTTTSTSTGTSSTTDGTSTTESSSTTGASTGDTDAGSTGDVSDCPGGAPTPGEAPYVSVAVDAMQNSDDVDIGDINGDGHLDLIAVATGAGAVETFFGDGTGAFTSDGVTVLNASGYPDTVRLGAIADDTVDLFVHMEGPVQLVVVRGDGAGSWPSPQVYMSTYVRAIDLADFNEDQVLDVAYVGASNLEVRLGTKAETLEAPTLYDENYGNVLRAADITGDENIDILTAQYDSTELQIYAGDGLGGFTALPTVVTGTAITGVEVGQLNDDALLDLVVTTTADLRVFYGQAEGGVSSTPGTIIEDALGRVRVADIDADGVEDLLTRETISVQIRFSAGDETFSDPENFSCPSAIRSIQIGDLNEDCVPDIVAATGLDQDLCVLLSDRT